ncbi:MAG: sugar lactone lactonase YvrE [Candidatus Poriferisodalaceae bacterium]|jgi:sugar lactone lactonase YvrE|tara:strand:- start:2701 stop:3537 length:837 start_codon:yes stop_codon:yes gene_type:complete
MKSEVLLRGLAFGEGPRWHDGKLWFSDFYRHGIFTVDVSGKEELILEVPSQPSGLGWLPSGDLIFVSMLDRSLKRLSSDGQVHLHADLSGIATGPCNDMVVSSDGTAYVGNFGFDEGEDYAQASLAIVYADGRVLAGPSGFDFPNGTVIDPAGRRLIVAESYGRRLTAFSIEENGALTDRREFADLGKRVPDGICLDAQGGIWVADPRNRSCFRVLEGGEVTEVIELEFNCFACMLGGSDRRTLFMMTAPAAGGNGLADGLEGRVETVRVEVAGVGLP